MIPAASTKFINPPENFARTYVRNVIHDEFASAMEEYRDN